MIRFIFSSDTFFDEWRLFFTFIKNETQREIEWNNVWNDMSLSCNFPYDTKKSYVEHSLNKFTNVKICNKILPHIFLLWDLEISDIANALNKLSNNVGCWEEEHSSCRMIPMLVIKNFQFVRHEIKLNCLSTAALLNDD